MKVFLLLIVLILFSCVEDNWVEIEQRVSKEIDLNSCVYTYNVQTYVWLRGGGHVIDLVDKKSVWNVKESMVDSIKADQYQRADEIKVLVESCLEKMEKQ